MQRRFRIGPPKIQRRCRIGPPKVSLNFLQQEFHSRGILLTIAIMKEKQQNNLFEIECALCPTSSVWPILGQVWTMYGPSHLVSSSIQIQKTLDYLTRNVASLTEIPTLSKLQNRQ